jgi:mycoredoxin
MSDGTVSDRTTLTMYSTTWCGYCRRLKSQLEREGIAYTEVDIENHPEAADFVMQVNNGNQTVPTVLFPDGSAATNPSLAEVKARLAAA